MPKENTHILFISEIVDALPCARTRERLKANYSLLCFGSVMADTFSSSALT